MKILFADKFPEEGLAKLREAGHQCDLQPDLDGQSLSGAIGDTEVLVVRSTKVTADTLHSASALRLVIRAGAGTNTIEKEVAAEKGIPVCNVPGKNAAAVAELTMGLLIALDRRIHENVIDLRAGRWNKKKYSASRGLLGQHMGILGLGAIGLEVAKRARAFGIHVWALDKPGRSDSAKQELTALGIQTAPDLSSLLGRCDIVSIHVPSAAETKGMVNASFLAAMRDGATLINTSRGDVVDEAALLTAMNERGIKAGLDVYADEPSAGEGSFSSALANHPNTCGTHHIGASTEQAQAAVSEGVLEIIDAFGSGRILHCVNGQG
ncbi:MAG: NAD(P)-dependent oxidoreductase [Arenicellales bacterium]